MSSVVLNVLDIAKYFCVAILIFYAYRVFKEFLVGQHRLREAMALGYTAIGAYFIFSGRGAIRMFATSVQETGQLLHVPDSASSALVICAAVICTAFLCNFSRSLWMLKILDHGKFPPIPNWSEFTENAPKRRIAEFLTRTCAAFLFIQVEHKLEELAQHSALQDLESAMAHELPHDYLSAAGWWGVALYVALIVWWVTGWLITRGKATAKMPRLQLLFFVAGLINSGFIGVYGKENNDKDLEWAMVGIVFFMAFCASYMLVVVVADLFNSAVEKMRKYFPRKPKLGEPATI